ncbi:hypothetical protein HW115_14480 [Verrucomicrobiaceae bacterium N1E253]|uniref:Lipid A biosynthesis acyltransferase n=1 Tax=Oceaniferula marina TaxID=2748318 RepID=A0A851GHJ4_9BACT|nr:hypothetical protein [Oceaniferula marina]NWK56826.1 hypothetical protein [Oceaniferula marina]
MSENNKQPKASVPDYVVYAIYRLFECLLSLLPMKWVCWSGSALGYLSSLLLVERRATVTRNLRIAFGDSMSHDDIRRLTRKTFMQTGANLIASIRTATFSPEKILQSIEITGEEHLLKTRKSEKGTICLLSHMGNWEFLAQAHLALPELKPTGTLYRPINNPLIDALIRRRRGSQGTKVFSRRDGFFKPIAHIKEGGSLGVLADQQAGAHGLAVPLFGKLTSLTNLPAILHRRTGAPIVPIAVSTIAPGKWKFTVYPALDIPENKQSNTVYITALCAQAYERAMSAHPADVLWMHGYWKTGRKRPLKIDGLQKKRTGHQRSAATHPFRVLVYTGSLSPSDTEHLNQLNRLKNYRPDLHLTTVGEHGFDCADAHILARASDTSPKLAHQIEQYNLDQAAPADCALDFTANAEGATIFHKAKIKRIFALIGPFQSPFTAKAFNKGDAQGLAGFLDSLGINA